MELSSSRTLLILEGVVFALLGILAIALPVASTFATELFIGWLLLIGGLFQGFQLFRKYRRRGFYATLLSALLNIAAGLLLILYPIAGTVTLTIFLIIFFFLQAIAEFILAYELRPRPNWGWLLVNGLLSLAMGIIIWANWPGSAFWVIGLLVGINMLFFGISLLALGIALPKNELKDESSDRKEL